MTQTSTIGMLSGPKNEFFGCADEPIHIPESIQPFGVLLVCNKQGAIVACSENLDWLLKGYAASDVLDQKMVSVFDKNPVLRDYLTHLFLNTDSGEIVKGSKRFSDRSDSKRAWDLLHHKNNQDLIVFEFIDRPPVLPLKHGYRSKNLRPEYGLIYRFILPGNLERVTKSCSSAF